MTRCCTSLLHPAPGWVVLRNAAAEAFFSSLEPQIVLEASLVRGGH
jgi:hypothetical protein